MQKQEEQAPVYLQLDQTQQPEAQHLTTKKRLLRLPFSRSARFARHFNSHRFPEQLPEILPARILVKNYGYKPKMMAPEMFELILTGL